MQEIIYPERLKRGDKVGLVAPAFPVSKERTELCVKAIEELGLKVELGARMEQDGWILEHFKEGDRQKWAGVKGYLETFYLAGRPESRAEDIHRMFADPEIKGIICARGGYGSAQVMPFLDKEIVAGNPKIFLGFSDITNILNWINQSCGFVAYHGPMASSNMVDPPMDAYSRSALEQAVFADWEELEFKNPEGDEPEVIVPGRAEGRLAGGNVTVFARTLGTFYQPDVRGRILFLEDVSEQVASLDMYFAQMENAGIFDQVSGILFGDFNECENKYEESYKVEELLRDRFSSKKIPVLAGLRCGHRAVTGTLPMGAWCAMDAEAGKVRFLRR